MDYQKHYDALIERARNRTLSGYKERHHAVPKCMGGSDEKSNLVYLTGPEHFVAHQLLCRVHKGNRKLIFAVNAMRMLGGARQPGVPVNKMFGWLRELHAAAITEQRLGTKRSEATKKKMVENRNPVHDKEHGRRVRDARANMTPEERSELSRKSWDTRRRNGNAEFSEEYRDKLSSAAAKRASRETDEEKSSRAEKTWEARRARGTDKLSDAAKEILREAALDRNKAMTPEQRSENARKAADSRKRNGTSGVSLETREKIRQARLGKPRSPETLAKIAATRERNRALKAANLSDSPT